MTLDREDLLTMKPGEMRRGEWVSCGYIAKTRRGAHLKVMIKDIEGTKRYFIADLGEVIQVINDERGSTKLMYHTE